MKRSSGRNVSALIPFAACLLPLLATNFVMARNGISPPAADTQQQSPSPLDVLDDCAVAVTNGEFARYVDHLTEEEQNIQAGFVVSMLAFVQQAQVLSGTEQDPEMILVTRALDDLLRKHATSQEAYEKTRLNGAEFQQAILGQVLLASAISSGNTHSAQMPGLPGIMGGDARVASLQSAEALKSPRDFLIETLTEITQPMVVTRNGKTEAKATVDVAEVLAAYRSSRWDLYTRGNYAIAVGMLTSAEADKATADASDAEHATADNAHAAGSNAAGPKPIVEFRKIDGQWKISRLLPANIMQGSMQLGAQQAAATTFPYYAPADALDFQAPGQSYPVTLPNPPVAPSSGIPYPAR